MSESGMRVGILAGAIGFACMVALGTLLALGSMSHVQDQQVLQDIGFQVNFYDTGTSSVEDTGLLAE